MTEWISVEDRLPDAYAKVLVVAFWRGCWQTFVGWLGFYSKKWYVRMGCLGEIEGLTVTHWMPFPEPPEMPEPSEENNV